MNRINTQQVGQNAETIACDYLTMKGLTLVTRNYRCKTGEIDLIMRDKDYLVFIEVRFRRHSLFGTSSETVTYSKQNKLTRAAHFYLQQMQLTHKIPCRFDVIAMTQNATQPVIEWIKNAF